ncbi:MAG TPA: SIS domain-containing protein [Planctomycetota bacterium]|nr:SIS domain-containing protein [Planctomycetota bacterium]
MCGIFGVLSSSGNEEAPPGDAFFQAIAELTSFGSDPGQLIIEDLKETARSAVLKKLETVQAACYSWMSRRAFLEALGDGDTQAKLRHAASVVTAWTEKLEGVVDQGGLTRQSDWEFLNRLIVGGKDIAWQVERDVLGNFIPVVGLLDPSRDLSPEEQKLALGHAFELNLVLTSLNRLEVRGRDSAGIAVYVRFPGSGALESFLDGPGDGTAWRHELDRRSRLPALTHGTLVRPRSSEATILAVFKVANETGKMGDNVAFLRDAIAHDAFFQAALRTPGVEIQCLAHTRWASNGVISLPNCHPVDSGAVSGGAGGAPTEPRGQGEIVAVLNGDVDNFQELLERHGRGEGLVIDPSITTDAKVIPIVVAHHYQRTRDLRQAFQDAFAELEGSMAIGLMAADHPGEILFGQKGSGQGLFFGLRGSAGAGTGAVVVASEMYGIVEFTSRYAKAEGERVEGGEVFHLAAGAGGVEIDLIDRHGARTLPSDRLRTAEITTRDINRGDKPHFFLKEIGESVESVRKTLRGKFETTGGGSARSRTPAARRVRFHLGTDVLTPKILEALQSGRVRRILVTGQGTAAVAGEGIALLLEHALRRARPAFHVLAMKASELSGHHLTEDMSGTLVVAVSQSGTTTDTNRTVDMVKERGAWVLGIVNRRNSDLVYKSHGVLYTSDGRDIEMSVASTKAFYAQNVAGQVLALAIAAELHALSDEELFEEVKCLERLPEALAATLRLASDVERLASKFALKRRHWAIVGSGMGKVAANEIRIKLSELCYKSIAVDFLEDKKHIDLSSEPMVLVCANGVPPSNVSDLVKEVAIFKAHKSIPIVITDEGEDRFDHYAAGTIKVPARAGSLGYLLATMVGHLFGYYSAARFDHFAERLRSIRAEVLGAPGIARSGGAGPLPASLTEKLIEMESAVASGSLDSGLNSGTATRLSRAFHALLGWMPVDVFIRHHEDLFSGVIGMVSEAISELSRPIDAIKHQAKTVTVGISRTEIPLAEGPLLAVLRSFELPVGDLADTHRRFLTALEPLVSQVEGTSLYRVEALDPLGRPTESSTIRVLRKSGCALKILSRSEECLPLSGTKWGVLKRGDIYMGFGKTDQRRILIVPVTGEKTEGYMILYHLNLVPRGRHDVRLRALEARPEHLERLQVAVTERNLPWDPDLIEAVDNDTLFFESPDRAAEEIVERSQVPLRKK